MIYLALGELVCSLLISIAENQTNLPGCNEDRHSPSAKHDVGAVTVSSFCLIPVTKSLSLPSLNKPSKIPTSFSENS